MTVFTFANFFVILLLENLLNSVVQYVGGLKAIFVRKSFEFSCAMHGRSESYFYNIRNVLYIMLLKFYVCVEVYKCDCTPNLGNQTEKCLEKEQLWKKVAQKTMVRIHESYQ